MDGASVGSQFSPSLETAILGPSKGGTLWELFSHVSSDPGNQFAGTFRVRTDGSPDAKLAGRRFGPEIASCGSQKRSVLGEKCTARGTRSLVFSINSSVFGMKMPGFLVKNAPI